MDDGKRVRKKQVNEKIENLEVIDGKEKALRACKFPTT